MNLRILACWSILVTLSATSFCQVTLFQDTEMNASDYDALFLVVDVQSTVLSGVPSNFNLQTTTSFAGSSGLGNAAPGRAVSHEFVGTVDQAVLSTSTKVVGSFVNTAHTLNPAVTPFSSLNIQVDTFGVGGENWFALGFYQGVNKFITGWFQTGPSVFTTSSFLNLTESDFGIIPGTNGWADHLFDNSVHPDFSASGGLIEFAVFTSQHATFEVPGIFNQIFAIDNFGVSYTPVPEPATILALGLGAAGLLRRRAK